MFLFLCSLIAEGSSASYVSYTSLLQREFQLQSRVSAATAADDVSPSSWEMSDAEIDAGGLSSLRPIDFARSSSRSADVTHLVVKYKEAEDTECTTPYRNQLQELDCILAEDPEYSTRLYGAHGRLPKAEMPNVNQLRMVWMSLLSMRSKARLNGLRVCLDRSNLTNKLYVMTPISPDKSLIPPASIWNHVPRTTWSEQGLPDDSWVEVTHCALHAPSSILESMGRAGTMAAGKMWFYGAPGSGISLNLGKTSSLGFFSTSDILTDAFIDLLEDHLTRFDSVQILHQEQYEYWWEIVVAYPGCGECETMTNASAHLSQRLKCGRDPYWIPCSNAEGTPLHLLDDCQGLRGLSDELIESAPCDVESKSV